LMMRVLFITNDFPNALQPTRGTFNYQMACALALEHDVAVISHVSWLDEWKRGVTGRRVERLRTIDRVRVWHPCYYYPPALLRVYHGWFLWWSVASVARRVLRDFKPDIVLAYWLHPDGEVAVKIAREARVPVVVMSGGSDVLVLARDIGRRRRMINVLQEADAVVCVSRHLKCAIEGMGIPSCKIHVVYRGVDRRRFSPGDRKEARSRLGLDRDRQVILWVGRMVAVKGLDTLIDACAALKTAGLDFTLCLLGGGPLRDVLVTRAARSGIAGDVRFFDRVDHDDLPDWYRAANLIALPSLSEGIPNVLLEAIACGSSFVATDVGGIGEIADARIDRVVPVGAPDAFAAAIRETLGRSEVAERRFEPDTWAESTERLAGVFQACIRPHVRSDANGSTWETGT
jgi:glycosyltransferase involved in cell wall biosynthesis